MEESNSRQQEFETNVTWLAKSVCSEHIYALAYQMIITANFFLERLMQWENVEEEIVRDAEMYGRVKTLVQIEIMRKFDTDEFMKDFLRAKNRS